MGLIMEGASWSAETVLDHSTDLAATTGPHDMSEVALQLLRAAGDDTTLDHALHIGAPPRSGPATTRATDRRS
jgi:hypothetical protein